MDDQTKKELEQLIPLITAMLPLLKERKGLFDKADVKKPQKVP